MEELREDGGVTSITVHNAFIAPLVAGRLLAIWESQKGREGSYEFDVKDDTLYFTIS